MGDKIMSTSNLSMDFSSKLDTVKWEIAFLRRDIMNGGCQGCKIEASIDGINVRLVDIIIGNWEREVVKLGQISNASSEAPTLPLYRSGLARLRELKSEYTQILYEQSVTNPAAKSGIRVIPVEFNPLLPKVYITKKSPTLVQKVKNAAYNNPWRTFTIVAALGLALDAYSGFPVTTSVSSTIIDGASSKAQELAGQYPLMGQISDVASPVFSSIGSFFSNQVAPTVVHCAELACSTGRSVLAAMKIMDPVPQPAWWKFW
jgi:hypothetical protein